MAINFTKMHGLGNDFVVIDAINQSIDLGPEQVRQLKHNGAARVSAAPGISGVADDIAGLLWMREEEQLAHDVYTALGEAWDLRIFSRIAASERRHVGGVVRLLEQFDITRLRKNKAGSLSGGERRRLEIARALASGPKFVLLDEPLAGIDPIAIGEIRELIGHLKHRGIVPITDLVRMRALEGGVRRVHVVSHDLPDSLLLEVFTDGGVGTLLTR